MRSLLIRLFKFAEEAELSALRQRVELLREESSSLRSTNSMLLNENHRYMGRIEALEARIEQHSEQRVDDLKNAADYALRSAGRRSMFQQDLEQPAEPRTPSDSLAALRWRGGRAADVVSFAARNQVLRTAMDENLMEGESDAARESGAGPGSSEAGTA